MRLKQDGGSIETYYNSLQGLWREIDFRRPNPMKCETDIQKYNSMLQEDRVYIFLDGVDDRLEKICADVLQLQPFPTVEQAYAYVRREDLRHMVMLTKEDTKSSMIMLSKGGRKPQQTSLRMITNGRPDTLMRSKAHIGEEGCAHYGNTKHTKDTCFKLHGYPDWWQDLKAKKKRESGHAALVNAENTPSLSIKPHLSLITQEDTSPTAANCSLAPADSGNCNWIIDSGATDHMTFDPKDFTKQTQPRRKSIINANGVKYPVTGAGKVTHSSSFSLSNTLLVPALSNKLLSVEQAAKELNCCVLIYPEFCFFQDILTKIIGRGTKQGGYITWMTLVLGRRTLLVIVVLKKEKFGCGITDWGIRLFHT